MTCIFPLKTLTLSKPSNVWHQTNTSIRPFPKPALTLISCPPGQHLLSLSQQRETRTSRTAEAVPQEPGRVLWVLSAAPALSQENLPKASLAQKPTNTAEQTPPMVHPPLVHRAQLLTCSSYTVKSFTAKAYIKNFLLICLKTIRPPQQSHEEKHIFSLDTHNHAGARNKKPCKDASQVTSYCNQNSNLNPQANAIPQSPMASPKLHRWIATERAANKEMMIYQQNTSQNKTIPLLSSHSWSETLRKVHSWKIKIHNNFK